MKPPLDSLTTAPAGRASGDDLMAVSHRRPYSVSGSVSEICPVSAYICMRLSGHLAAVSHGVPHNVGKAFRCLGPGRQPSGVTVRSSRYGHAAGPTGRWRCRRPAPVDVPCAGRAPEPDRLAVRRCLPDCRHAGYRLDRTVTEQLSTEQPAALRQPAAPAARQRRHAASIAMRSGASQVGTCAVLFMQPMIRRAPGARCPGSSPTGVSCRWTAGRAQAGLRPR